MLWFWARHATMLRISFHWSNWFYAIFIRNAIVQLFHSRLQDIRFPIPNYRWTCHDGRRREYFSISIQRIWMRTNRRLGHVVTQGKSGSPITLSNATQPFSHTLANVPCELQCKRKMRNLALARIAMILHLCSGHALTRTNTNNNSK